MTPPLNLTASLHSAGTDCTDEFYGLHRSEVIDKYGPRLKVGVLESYDEDDVHTTWRDISEVPFGEAPFWQGGNSPYYNESHEAFRLALRHW